MTTRSTLLFILNLLSTFVGIIIGARVLLMMLGVNQSVPVVAWIMSASNVFVYPFRGLFGNIYVSGDASIDITAIISLLIYAVIFSILYKVAFNLTHTAIDDEIALHSHL